MYLFWSRVIDLSGLAQHQQQRRIAFLNLCCLAHGPGAQKKGSQSKTEILIDPLFDADLRGETDVIPVCMHARIF